jgi:hypothetical protein
MIQEEYVVASPLCYVLDDRQWAGLLSVEVLICCFPHMSDASCVIQFADYWHGIFPFSGGVASCLCRNFAMMLLPCNVFLCLVVFGRKKLFLLFGTSRGG